MEVSPGRRIKNRPSVPSAAQPRRRTLFALAGFLALATVVAYSNTFDVPFLFDDIFRIQDNVLIRHLWPLWIPMADSNRPFGMVTFAVNYALHGYQVWGYHAVNIAIHILSGLTLFGIVRRTLTLRDLANRSHFSATSLAFAIALIWLVHPLNTQAVTYIVQRLESLMGLCYLATLYCFIRGHESIRRGGWYAASIACCGIGMGIKEVIVTAPVMVVWYHRAFLADSWRAVFRDHGRYYAGLFSTWIVLAWCMLRTQSEYSAGHIAFVKGVTPLSYLLSQAGVITHYLRLSVWPYGQCLDYGWPVATTANEIVPPLIFVVALFTATVWAIFRHPAWGFLGGWFFVILGPTSSVIPIIDLAFEQRMYLPFAAVVSAGVLALDGTIRYLAIQWHLSPKRLSYVGAGLLAIVTLQMSVLTWGRNEVYRSQVGIWEDTVNKAPENARARNNLGSALQEQGAVEIAVEHYRQTIRVKPDFAEAHSNLASALLRQHEYELAEEPSREAIRLNPKFPEAHSNLGDSLLGQGKMEIAVEQYREAIRLKPDYAEAYNNLANALQAQGNLDAAIEQYREAIWLNPGYAQAYSNLASVLLDQRKHALAEEPCRTAIRLKPQHAEAYNNLGNSLQGQGKTVAAIEQYHQAIQLNPEFAAAYHNRSIAYYELGDYDRAWSDIRACRRLGMSPNPAHLQALVAASGRSD